MANRPGWLGGDDPRFPAEIQDEIDALAAEFHTLRQQDDERLSRYATYRKELEAGRYQQMIPLDAVSVADYGRVRQQAETGREWIEVPLGQVMTAKQTHLITGRLPSPIVDRRQETAAERYRSDTMEKIWWSTLRNSGETTLVADGAWDGSALGAACFEVYMSEYGKVPYPVLRNVDPSGVLVVRGSNDPHDFTRVYRWWQAPLASMKVNERGQSYSGFEVPVDHIQSTHKTGLIPMGTYVQCATKNFTVRFTLSSPTEKTKHNVPVARKDHNLGFTPYIVIPNVGPYRDVWGWADYEFVRGLVRYIPQLLSREADIIKAVANGAMIDKGTGEDPEVLKAIQQKGGIISSKKDGEFEPVPTPEIPAFQVEHAARVLEYLTMVGFTPDAAWGGGNAGSGSDRGLQLLPRLELAQLKQANWSAGFSRLAAYLYQTIEKMQRGTVAYSGARPSRAGVMQSFKPALLGPDEQPETVTTMTGAPGEEEEETFEAPRSPKELFDGEYQVRFVWQNRIDPDDPAYVTSELNKFQQGAQSLRRTLENLGVENPEDEIRVIEAEAQKHPWLRNGMIQMLKNEMDAALQMQGQEGGGLSSQGEGGGAPFDVGGGLMRAAQTMMTKDGSALDADAQRQSLPGSTGNPYGGA